MRDNAGEGIIVVVLSRIPEQTDHDLLDSHLSSALTQVFARLPSHLILVQSGFAA